MQRWVPRAIAAIAFVFLLAWVGDAWAVGVLRCDVADPSDSLDILNGGADGNLIFIFVAATSDLLGGPKLDPFIQVNGLSDNRFIACNDDNGSTFGGCSAFSTINLTGLSFNNGPFQLYNIGAFDSFVFFVNPPDGVRITIRSSISPAPGRAPCGAYTVHIFGA